MKNVSGQVAIIGPKGESLPAKNGASVPVEAPLGDSVYQLKDGKTVLASVTIAVTCDTKLEAKDGKCEKKVVASLHYDVIVMRNSYKKMMLPTRIQGESCAQVTIETAKNQTSYPDNPDWNFSLFNLEVAKKLANGYIPVRLQVVADNSKGQAFLYDPVANVVLNDDGEHGTLPPAYPNDDPPWQSVSPDNHPDPVIGRWAQSAHLLVYTDRRSYLLYCEDVVAGQRSGKPVVIADYTAVDGLVPGLWHYSN